MVKMSKFDFNYKTNKYNLKNALRLAEVSQLAYKSKREVKKHVKDKWGFNKFEFFDRKHTQAYMIANDEMVILAFRGTESKQDWLTDVNAKLVEGNFGKIHRGFSRALGYVWNDIEKTLSRFGTNSRPVWITGHSLGGALATLAAAKFIELNKDVNGLYTFGQPRVGDSIFGTTFDLRFKHRTFRFVNNEDIVTRVPPRTMGYKHIGSIVYFDSFGKIHKDIKWWQRFLDSSVSKVIRAADRYKILNKEFPNGFNDHGIDKYIKRIRKNMA